MAPLRMVRGVAAIGSDANGRAAMISALLQIIEAVARESGAPNWDGYGGKAVTPETKVKAIWFANAIPIGLPMPSVGAEPDGSIAFDWTVSPRQTFSVSVSEDGSLAYAGLFGGMGDDQTKQGVEKFDGTIPANIIEMISRVFNGPQEMEQP